MDLKQKIAQRQDQIVQNLAKWIRCGSVYDEKTRGVNAPFGAGVAAALNYIADLAKKDGFQVDTCDGYCTEITYGDCQEMVMVLGHADVVPVGKGWQDDPFSGIVKDRKIYGRGTSDDKGPTFAAYQALKLIKEENIPLKRKIRIVVGGNEESGSRCLDYYFNRLHKPHPTYGFTPDASFPLIYGEKGIMNFEYSGTIDDALIASFEGGIVANSVPEEARVVFKKEVDLKAKFEKYLAKKELQGEYRVENGVTVLKLQGKAAHGSTPMYGVNALTHLLRFLAKNTDSALCQHFGRCLACYYGKELGIQHDGSLMGPLTVNVGLGQYLDNQYRFILNIRYPNDINVGSMTSNLHSHGMHEVRVLSDSKPLFIDPKSPFILALLEVYHKVTNDQTSQPFTIGGGTYARQTNNTEAYGMEFPENGRGSGKIHSPNECLHIDDLLDGVAIYYEALKKLNQL